jgi:lipoprotein-releasing system ATP-binding protein
METAGESAIEAFGIGKRYRTAGGELAILDRLDLAVAPGERIAIVGESGAGKTTLLHLLGGLERPDSGSIRYGSTDLTALSGDRLARFRGSAIGFVWQRSSLLPEFTALENAAMPLRIAGVSPREAERTAAERLEEVGLSARASHRPGELSGGEQQRVALARALAANPHALLADEPTGNLDTATAERIILMLEELHRRRSLTSVIVTHNREFASRCDRVLELREGRLERSTMEMRS